MMAFKKQSKCVVGFISLLILYSAVSAAVMDRFMKEHAYTGGFIKYLEQQVPKPFSYRILIPTIVKYIEPIITPKINDELAKKFTSTTPLLEEYMGKNNNKQTDDLRVSIRYHLGYFIAYFSLVAFAFMLRELSFSVAPHDRHLANLAPIAFIALLPLTFLHGGFLYDFPELFLLSIAFWAILNQNLLILSLVTPIAILNKESNILIPFIYTIFIYGVFSFPRYVIRVSYFIVLGLASFSIGRYLTPETGGVTVMDKLCQNLEFYADPKSWFLWHRPFGGLIPFPRGYNLIFIGLLAYLIYTSWIKTQDNIKRIFTFTAITNCYLIVAHGNIDEVRAWSITFIPLYLIIISGQSLNKELQIKNIIPDS